MSEFKNEPATEKQLALMKKLGIAQTVGLTKYRARKLIDEKLHPENAPKDITEQYSQDEASGNAPKTLDNSLDFIHPDDVQVLIVRQSCLKAAIEIHNAEPDKKKGDISPQMIMKLAEEFEKWVFR